ncbi:aminoglycoside adenylyltransferase family protein [Streptomyces sp. NPDC052013]|uniref:aminoglycoside adenylyltransferase family protein n=1 Tax=Streptomyces sp. NPDC052013 TaxID=3365679 RepID=UPI0037D7B861
MPERSSIDHLVRLVRGVLGDDALGVYLHGSATLGGLRPHSDIDLLVVVRRSLAPEQRRALTAELLKVSGGDRRPVELIAVTRDAVRPWRYPPECDFLYGEWLREEYESGVLPAPEPCPDLAPLLTMVLRANAPVYGPPPAALLDPVPHTDVRRAVVDGLPQLVGELETDTRNVLLTLCRIWLTLDTGTIGSKDAAADWVLDRVPDTHRGAIARARAVYVGQREERWDDLRAEILPCADFLVRAIRAACVS